MYSRDNNTILYKNTFVHVCHTEELEETHFVKYNRRFSFDSLLRTRTGVSATDTLLPPSLASTPIGSRSKKGSMNVDECPTEIRSAGEVLSTQALIPDKKSQSANSTLTEAAITSEVISTIMVRNIPGRYLPHSLRADIDKAGFEGLYDFFYMPCDVSARVNLGYCFINFRNNELVPLFLEGFHGKQFPRYRSSKLLEVTSAKIQGFHRNVDSLMKSSVVSLLPDEFKPVMLMDEMFVPFPSPPKRARTSRSYD
jgi:hypothetical protein